MQNHAIGVEEKGVLAKLRLHRHDAAASHGLQETEEFMLEALRRGCDHC